MEKFDIFFKAFVLAACLYLMFYTTQNNFILREIRTKMILMQGDVKDLAEIFRLPGIIYGK